MSVQIIPKQQWDAMEAAKRHAPTKKELSEFVYQEKCKAAYNGIIVNKDNTDYLFQTDSQSIAMANAKITALSVLPDDATVDWKCYSNDVPVLVTFTKQQFQTVFVFGNTMIDSCFATEGDFNTEIQSMTDAQLNDPETVENFKARATSSFGQIIKRVVVD